MQVEKVTKYIISWLKEYATNARVKGFVIGVSGGIDSAVTSTFSTCIENYFSIFIIHNT